MSDLWILGSGGHARVVIETARAAGMVVLGVLGRQYGEPASWLRDVSTISPMSTDVIVRHRIERALVAVGDNRRRAELSHQFSAVKAWPTLVHPSAYVSPDAELGEGTVVCAGAVVQPGARIGRHAVINTSSSVDHECRIGDFAQIAPGAHLGGEVTVDCGAFVGIGASVLPRVRIGAWTMVGAGAVVLRDLPDGVTAIGVPATIMPPRTLT